MEGAGARHPGRPGRSRPLRRPARSPERPSPTTRPEPRAPDAAACAAAVARFLPPAEAAARTPSAAAGRRAARRAVDIVDQAEAFQTLRVADVMTPARRHRRRRDRRRRSTRWCASSPRPSIRACRSIARPSTTRWAWSTSRTCSSCWPPSGQPKPRPRTEPVLHRLRREVLYVPASMRAADLLLRMQASAHPHGPGHRRVRRHRRPGHPGGPARGRGRRDRRRARRGRTPGVVAASRRRAARPTPARRWRSWRPRSASSLAPADLEEEIDTVGRPGHRPGRPRAAARRGHRPSRRLRLRGHRRRSAPGEAGARAAAPRRPRATPA